MKTKFSGILTLLLAFVVQVSFAQTAVSGTVSDDAGPLPGANVIIKGTNNGTQTDFDGNYSIQASPSDVLVFSYVGFGSQEVVVGNQTTINVVLQSESLDEVIVTAQGVKREKKALGYAVSEVASEEIESRTEGDVARVLSGKASGVAITSQSGTSGSATNVVIRGYNSINGSNQALFIVDGVPFSSDTNNQGNFVNGNNGSSRFLDLDPNNIESVNVLKGLAAATLYGTAGRNGVIVITTKSGVSRKGPKKTEITVNQSFFANEIASLPDYQDTYGGGFDQSFGWFFSNWGPAFAADGVDGFLNDPAQLIDANGTVEHPYSSSAFLDNFQGGNNILQNEFQGQRYEYRPYNNVDAFFRTGAVSNTSINVNGGSEDGKISYNLNYGHLDDEGFLPGNTLRRNTLSVGGRAQLSNKFTVTGTLNFSRTDFSSPPLAASLGNGTTGFSVFGNVFFTPRNVDLVNLPFTIPETGGSIYYRDGNDINNPNWTVENASNSQLTNRVFGTTSLQYNINDNLNILYRAGIDFYNERNISVVNRGGVLGVGAVATNNPLTQPVDDINGEYRTWDNNNRIWDHYLAVSGDYDLSDKIGMTFIAGATSRSVNFDRQGVASVGQIVFGVQRHFNFLTQAPIQFTDFQNIVGVLGQADFDYDNYAFLTLAARNDWVSNLPTQNNSQFYPSASISFLPTAAFDGLRSDALNYLKVRAGLGTSAGFPANFPVSDNVVQLTNTALDPNNGAAIVSNNLSAFRANPDLKPELISEFEVGFDARLWKNRISLDFSYFDRATDDLIVNQPLAPSTGFTNTQANIGKVEGDGFEIDLGVDIFKSEGDGFNWNSRVNFTQSEQIVTEQNEDIIVFAGFGNLGNAAIRGEQLGVIVGDRILRDGDGNFVVNAAGNYVSEPNITTDDGRNIQPIIGNPQPDYIMNFINTLSYKNFNLGFQVNHTKGGDIYASTISVLLGRGLIVETEDRENTFILPGVNVDANGVSTPNQTQINNSQYYFSNILFGPSELQVYDGSVVRLQEISFGYSVPKKYLEKTPFGSFSITASGFNLWYDAYNTPDGANFDPNVAGVGVGNGRGFDFLNGPSSKRYGISVKASF